MTFDVDYFTEALVFWAEFNRPWSDDEIVAECVRRGVWLYE